MRAQLQKKIKNRKEIKITYNAANCTDIIKIFYIWGSFIFVSLLFGSANCFFGG